MTAPLPPWLRVVVRGWLNCNQIVLRGQTENCVIDAGHVSHAAATVERLRAPDALGEAPLHRLVNTHGHSDHVGGNATLVREFGCRVEIPRAYAAAIGAWERDAMWLDYTEQRSERFAFDGTLEPGDRTRMGEAEWVAVAAPGHDPAALMYFCPEWRLLASGDALWENGMGVVLSADGDTRPYDQALETLDVIEALDPAWVLPGHGAPFDGVGASLGRARERLAALRADPRRAARHALKVMLVFSILEAGGARWASIPGLVARVPIYRDLNARYLALAPEALAALLVDELERAGVVARRDDLLVPLIPA
jgi:glyoxylase-like metal-dependent hydrolase (beta-lactamase superfamily II)